jgi:hypothetical protein
MVGHDDEVDTILRTVKLDFVLPGQCQIGERLVLWLRASNRNPPECKIASMGLSTG